MNRKLVVGAQRIVDRPWPTGPGDVDVEMRHVPEGMVHAVDPDTGRAVCDSDEPLVHLDTPWDDKWTLSYIGGPSACRRCTFRLWAAEKPSNATYTALELPLAAEHRRNPPPPMTAHAAAVGDDRLTPLCRQADLQLVPIDWEWTSLDTYDSVIRCPLCMDRYPNP